MSLSDLAWWRDVASRCGRQAVQLLLPFFALAATGDLTGIQPLAVLDVVGVGVAVVLLKAIAGATVETTRSWWVQAAERAASAGAAAAAAFVIGDKTSLFNLDYRTVGLAVLGSALTSVAMMLTNPPGKVIEGQVLASTDTHIPAPGRTALYTLTEQDAAAINRRRSDASLNLRQIREERPGFQAHVGNSVSAGDRYPLLITRVWNTDPGTVNGQVQLDGNDVLWVTSTVPGTAPGRYQWPTPAVASR